MDATDAAAPVDLPPACSLGAGDGAARLRRWRALAQRSQRGCRRSEHQLEIRWRLDTVAATELDLLVAAERECCAFVSWSVGHEDADTILRITADASRPEDLDAIASLFAVS